MAKKSLAMKIENVSMKFNLSSEKVDNIKEYVIKMMKKELMFQEFWALRDISFEVQKGDRVGIMGLNGAGKSTLLKVISGAENIYLYGAMLGYSKEFLEARYDEIVEFSELGSFIDVPVKNYSSGMRARLGFSVATIVEPDILILDEVLSVGDAKFRKKCENRIQSMFDKGVTVIFVSHSTSQVLRMCNKGILLEQGRLIAQGDVEDVVSVYEAKMSENE